MSGEVFLYCLMGGVLVAGSYGAAAVLHEGGHALFGRLAGGKCLWIRLGRFLWVPGGGVFVGVKENFWKKWRRDFAENERIILVSEKKDLVGAGECVLSCPDRKSLLWAALGGPAGNLISVLLAGAVRIGAGCAGKEFYSLKGLAFLLFMLCSLLMEFLSLFMGKREGNDGSLAGKLYRSQEFCRQMQQNQQRDLLRLEFGLVEEMF